MKIEQRYPSQQPPVEHQYRQPNYYPISKSPESRVNSNFRRNLFIAILVPTLAAAALTAGLKGRNERHNPALSPNPNPNHYQFLPDLHMNSVQVMADIAAFPTQPAPTEVWDYPFTPEPLPHSPEQPVGDNLETDTIYEENVEGNLITIMDLSKGALLVPIYGNLSERDQLGTLEKRNIFSIETNTLEEFFFQGYSQYGDNLSHVFTGTYNSCREKRDNKGFCTITHPVKFFDLIINGLLSPGAYKGHWKSLIMTEKGAKVLPFNKDDFNIPAHDIIYSGLDWVAKDGDERFQRAMYVPIGTPDAEGYKPQLLIMISKPYTSEEAASFLERVYNVNRNEIFSGDSGWLVGKYGQAGWDDDTEGNKLQPLTYGALKTTPPEYQQRFLQTP